jgi:hypothetical protein
MCHPEEKEKGKKKNRELMSLNICERAAVVVDLWSLSFCENQTIYITRRK